MSVLNDAFGTVFNELKYNIAQHEHFNYIVAFDILNKIICENSMRKRCNCIVFGFLFSSIFAMNRWTVETNKDFHDIIK